MKIGIIDKAAGSVEGINPRSCKNHPAAFFLEIKKCYVRMS